LALSALWAAPNADEIVKKSVANTMADWHGAPEYNFTERDVTQNGEGTKTSRVMMIDGSPYYELIARNGTPLPPDQAAEEEQKLKQETAKRQRETPAQRRSASSRTNGSAARMRPSCGAWPPPSISASQVKKPSMGIAVSYW
jgi:hypothetical protein